MLRQNGNASTPPILTWYLVWASTAEDEPRVGNFLVRAGLPAFTIVITSLGAQTPVNDAVHSYGGVVLHDVRFFNLYRRGLSGLALGVAHVPAVGHEAARAHRRDRGCAAG